MSETITKIAERSKLAKDAYVTTACAESSTKYDVRNIENRLQV